MASPSAPYSNVMSRFQLIFTHLINAMHELVEKIKRYFEAKQLLHAGTRGAWLLGVLALFRVFLSGSSSYSSGY
jgi:hypothetical protein